MTAPRSHHERGQLFGTDGRNSWVEPELPLEDPPPVDRCDNCGYGPWDCECWRLDTGDYGGAEDGFGHVISDADPGL
jgi:hypothetical protein